MTKLCKANEERIKELEESGLIQCYFIIRGIKEGAENEIKAREDEDCCCINYNKRPCKCKKQIRKEFLTKLKHSSNCAKFKCRECENIRNEIKELGGK